VKSKVGTPVTPAAAAARRRVHARERADLFRRRERRRRVEPRRASDVRELLVAVEVAPWRQYASKTAARKRSSLPASRAYCATARTLRVLASRSGERRSRMPKPAAKRFTYPSIASGSGRYDASGTPPRGVSGCSS
jgi:hypothetical protein